MGNASNVWTVFHRAYRAFGDVAVAEARSDDPTEWARAYNYAVVNAETCESQAIRWRRIAKELSTGYRQARANSSNDGGN